MSFWANSSRDQPRREPFGTGRGLRVALAGKIPTSGIGSQNCGTLPGTGAELCAFCAFWDVGKLPWKRLVSHSCDSRISFFSGTIGILSLFFCSLTSARSMIVSHMFSLIGESSHTEMLVKQWPWNISVKDLTSVLFSSELWLWNMPIPRPSLAWTYGELTSCWLHPVVFPCKIAWICYPVLGRERFRATGIYVLCGESQLELQIDFPVATMGDLQDPKMEVR